MPKIGEAFIELRADMSKLRADFTSAQSQVARGARGLTRTAQDQLRGLELGARTDLLSAMGLNKEAAKAQIEQVLATQMAGLRRIEAAWKMSGRKITASERTRMANLRRQFARTAKLRRDALRPGGGRPSGAALGIGVAVGFALFVRQVTAAVKAATDFQREMAFVSTMLTNVTGQLPGLTRGLEAMSLEFGQSTKVLSKGLFDILSASIDASKAIDVLRVASQAAVGGFTNAAVAVDGITSLLNAYGLEASEAGRVSDILFATVRRGKTTFPELAAGIGRVASVAATAGVSLEEVGAFLATLTRAGIRTDQAIVALNAILLGFIKPTKGARDAAEQMGLALNKDALAADGLIGSLARLRQANVEQLASVFPNIRAIKGVAAAVKQLDGLQADLAVTMNATGDAEAAFIKASDTAAFATEQLSQSTTKASRDAGSVFAPALFLAKGAANQLTSGISEATGAVSEMQLALLEFLGIDIDSKLQNLRQRFQELGDAALSAGELKAIGEARGDVDQKRELEAAKERLKEAQKFRDDTAALIGTFFGGEGGDPLVGIANATDFWLDALDEANLSLSHATLSLRDMEDAQAAVAKAAEDAATAAFDLRRNQEAAQVATERWVSDIEAGVSALTGLAKAGLERVGFDVGGGAGRQALARTEAATLRLGGRRAEGAMKLEDVRHQQALQNIAKEQAARTNQTARELALFDKRRAAENERHMLSLSNLKTEAIREQIARDFAFEDEFDKFGEIAKKGGMGARLASLREISRAAAGKLGGGGPDQEREQTEAAKATAKNTGSLPAIADKLDAIGAKVGAWQ